MPAVTVTQFIKPVELMAAQDPGDLLIETLRTLGSKGAQEARQAGADPDAVLAPQLVLALTLHWE